MMYHVDMTKVMMSEQLAKLIKSKKDKLELLNYAITQVEKHIDYENNYCCGMCAPIDSYLMGRYIFLSGYGTEGYSLVIPKYKRWRYVLKYWYVPAVWLHLIFLNSFWDNKNVKGGLRRINFLNSLKKDFE